MPIRADARHDRTLRLMQQAFDWAVPPTADALLEVANDLDVDVRLRGDGRAQDQLAALALLNVLGRLPIGALQVLCGTESLATALPPYRGVRLVDAIEDLASRLDVTPDIGVDPNRGEWAITIRSPSETATWGIALDGSRAYLGHGGLLSSTEFNSVGCYTLASMVGGEFVRAWARAAAYLGAGSPGPRFEARSRAANERWLDLHHDYSRAYRKTAAAALHPTIDWVSCGAVNQAALAVLAPHPDISLVGRVFDPGYLDAPDLNRSLVSFTEDLELPKAQVGAEAAGGLTWRRGRYPHALDTPAAPWIICGTDDPSVRPACQQLWPRRLLVTATEELFGYAAWHARDERDAFCAACEPAPPLDTSEPIPTSTPTSVIAGVAVAALLIELATGNEPPHRTDLLTLRLDSPLAVDRANPRPSPDCPVCSDQAA